MYRDKRSTSTAAATSLRKHSHIIYVVLSLKPKHWVGCAEPSITSIGLGRVLGIGLGRVLGALAIHNASAPSNRIGIAKWSMSAHNCAGLEANRKPL